jgi:hypothetical protein
MRTALIAGLVVIAASLPVGAQKPTESTPSAVPKKGDAISVKGCLRGGALEATEVTGAETSNLLQGPIKFRLTGDKAVLKSLRSEHDRRIVEVRGILKSDLPGDAEQSRQLGKVRIAIGAPSPSPNSPEAAARRSQPVLEVRSFDGLGTSCGR